MATCPAAGSAQARSIQRGVVYMGTSAGNARKESAEQTPRSEPQASEVVQTAIRTIRSSTQRSTPPGWAANSGATRSLVRTCSMGRGSSSS